MYVFSLSDNWILRLYIVKGENSSGTDYMPKEEMLSLYTNPKDKTPTEEAANIAPSVGTVRV